MDEKIICPNCDFENPSNAKFCSNCGFAFTEEKEKFSLFQDGRIFIIAIVVVLIIGGAWIFTNSFDNTKNLPSTIAITDVTQSDYIYNQTNYPDEFEITTQALISGLPDSTDKCVLKTTYYDKNNRTIGQVTDSLDSVLLNNKWGEEYFFGQYDSNTKLIPKYVHVELLDNGELIGQADYTVSDNQSLNP